MFFGRHDDEHQTAHAAVINSHQGADTVDQRDIVAAGDWLRYACYETKNYTKSVMETLLVE